MKTLRRSTKRQHHQRQDDQPLPSHQQYQAGGWVPLAVLPVEGSHDEALLLCELEPGQWLTWVPDYGEFTLTLFP